MCDNVIKKWTDICKVFRSHWRKGNTVKTAYSGSEQRLWITKLETESLLYE